MENLLKKWFGGGGDQKQESPKLPTVEEAIAAVEEAIAAWESDIKKNRDHLKIVRGVDGKPVEIVFGYPNSKVVVNGQETIYDGTEEQLSQILVNLEFKNFLPAMYMMVGTKLEAV